MIYSLAFCQTTRMSIIEASIWFAENLARLDHASGFGLAHQLAFGLRFLWRCSCTESLQHVLGALWIAADTGSGCEQQHLRCRILDLLAQSGLLGSVPLASIAAFAGLALPWPSRHQHRRFVCRDRCKGVSSAVKYLQSWYPRCAGCPLQNQANAV